MKLTRKGAGLLKKMRPVADQVDRELLKAIPKDRKDIFMSVLAQMVESLSARDDATQ